VSKNCCSRKLEYFFAAFIIFILSQSTDLDAPRYFNFKHPTLLHLMIEYNAEPFAYRQIELLKNTRQLCNAPGIFIAIT